ncbi:MULTISPECIES: recombinase family protein [unclassified Pseudomonas]|uniref:Recombinase family protein n=1 Tax=Pseudomonas sp. MYb327 TaxID=2745230 RepID=A0AAU8DXM8_9PSED
MDVVAYYRVSTKGQGESGLGIEAQKEYVRFAAEKQGWTVVVEYEDVGVSGSIHPLGRPGAANAFADGRPVVVAKLDRLSRDVEHIAGLMKRNNFKVATMPNASTVELHIYAVLAEQERTFISERTKAALKSLDVRAEAGDIDALHSLANREDKLRKGRSMLNRAKGHDTQRKQADHRADTVEDAIENCILKGATSLQAVAECLISRNIPTARKGRWSPTAVMRVMQRLGLELNKANAASVGS